MKQCTILGLLLLSLTHAFSQAEAERVRVAFYNLENLFYPEDDSLKSDEEFTPQGQRYWSYYRYREKSNRMAKAILSIGEWEAPDIVGVAEIENRQVLQDLVESPTLAPFHYRVVHFESPDRRGIDVGMIYREERFTLLSAKPVPVTLPDDPGFATRDILYAKGIIYQSDTIHLFYCHWPSRYGGQQQSEPKRIRAATIVKHITDSLLTYNAQANIIIAGDFNDEWTNTSLLETLAARKPEEKPQTSTLYNLMAALDPNEGSHRYQGVWAYLDQIIVNFALLDNEGVDVYGNRAQVCRADHFLESDDKYPGQKPFRTFIGMRYHGGFSDHLPVFIDLVQTGQDKEE